MHSFTFGKTSVHIGAEKTQNIQLEFEEECKMYNEQIGAIEKALNARGSLQTVPRLAISQEANTDACSQFPFYAETPSNDDVLFSDRNDRKNFRENRIRDGA